MFRLMTGAVRTWLRGRASLAPALDQCQWRLTPAVIHRPEILIAKLGLQHQGAYRDLGGPQNETGGDADADHGNTRHGQSKPGYG